MRRCARRPKPCATARRPKTRPSSPSCQDRHGLAACYARAALSDRSQRNGFFERLETRRLTTKASPTGSCSKQAGSVRRPRLRPSLQRVRREAGCYPASRSRSSARSALAKWIMGRTGRSEGKIPGNWAARAILVAGSGTSRVDRPELFILYASAFTVPGSTASWGVKRECMAMPMGSCFRSTRGPVGDEALKLAVVFLIYLRTVLTRAAPRALVPTPLRPPRLPPHKPHLVYIATMRGCGGCGSSSSACYCCCSSIAACSSPSASASASSSVSAATPASPAGAPGCCSTAAGCSAPPSSSTASAPSSPRRAERRLMCGQGGGVVRCEV